MRLSPVWKRPRSSPLDPPPRAIPPVIALLWVGVWGSAQQRPGPLRSVPRVSTSTVARGRDSAIASAAAAQRTASSRAPSAIHHGVRCVAVLWSPPGARYQGAV
jgi:hypothetical protein